MKTFQKCLRALSGWKGRLKRHLWLKNRTKVDIKEILPILQSPRGGIRQRTSKKQRKRKLSSPNEHNFAIEKCKKAKVRFFTSDPTCCLVTSPPRPCICVRWLWCCGHWECAPVFQPRCETPGLVTNSILFCWLFAIKDRYKQTHSPGLRQLLLTESWDLRA